MISILIPVYNESDTLAPSLAKLAAYLTDVGLISAGSQDYSQVEVLITDNGSTDRTFEIVQELALKYPWVVPNRIPQRGPGRAFSSAAMRARGDIIITLDIDLSSDLKFIEYARDLLQYADCVVGSKTMGNQRRTVLRILGSQFYIMCAQVLFDLTISDYSIGCKAFRRAVILPVVQHLDPWTGFMLEAVLYLKSRCHTILQISIDCNDTRKSRFSLLHEGLFRFRHMARCRKLLRTPGTWLALPIAIIKSRCQ